MTFATPTVRASRTLLLLALVSLVLTACGRQNPYGNNQPPTVNAGVDQQVNEGTAVTLTGSASDADGQLAGVQWQQTAGPVVTLAGATTLTLAFDAPAVNARTELHFRLSATDDDGAVGSDEVVVSIGDVPLSNRLPVVNAGLDQSVNEGSAVTLTGSATDEDGTVTSVQWTQTAGPEVTLTGANTTNMSFTAPTVTAATVLSFSLAATDNTGDSSSDTVNVTVQDIAAANQQPIADAGANQNVDEGSTVTLMGSGSDADGSIASYEWTQVSGPTVTPFDAAAARPSFTAPPVAADTELVFELVVTDDKGARSAADRSTVLVRNIPTANQSPTASAGGDQSVNEGVVVTLSGSGSSDPDGTVQSYAWTQTAGQPAVTLTGANTATPSFTAPQVDALTTLSFSLTVTDNGGATASDTVDVRVQDIPASNLLPVADAGPDQSVNEGVVVSLPGTDSDPDGTVTSRLWTKVSGPEVTLNNANTSTASFTAPLVTTNTSLVFRYTVTDNNGATKSDDVAVLVRDTAVVAAACAPGAFCVGSAKRSINPSDVQVAGITEDRLAGQTVNQTFHLGGFGIGPFDAFGPFNDLIANPPASRAVHCKGLRPACVPADEERTWVRAIYLSQPDAAGVGTQVLFVTIDATGAGNLIQRDVTNAISAETGVPAENILFGQTHTHSGADLQGLWGGVPQDWVQNVLISQAAVAAKEALLNARKADVTYAMGRDSAFNNYRRPRQTDPLADSDDRLSVLLARDSLDHVLATLVQYTAHPTAIGTGSGGALGRVPHPDYPLGLEDTLEASFGATAVYYNGAIADASGSGPTVGSDPYAQVRSRGECLAKSVLTALNPAAPQQCYFSLLNPAEVVTTKLAPTLTVRHATAILPVTNPVFLAGAAAGAFNRYYDFTPLPLASVPGIGPVLAAQQTNLPQIAPTASTLVSRITLGGADAGLEIVTIPGEATNTFGQYIRRLAKSPNMMLMGLTHNSFGYIIPEDEFSYIDASGNDGFVAPFTGYEEFVSLGPLTAPMLRLQAYNPLFDVTTADVRNLPPSLVACMDDPAARDCIISETLFHLDYIQHAYAQTCRENLVGNAPDQLKDAANSFCDLLDPETPLAQPCRDAGGPEAVCAVFGNGGAAPSGGGDSTLAQSALDSLLRGCDLLDASACLYPFPNNFFTVPASTGSPQDVANGGTGLRVNFSLAATPRNSAGKPVDPEDWNRNDGFSPGALIATYVPALSLEKTYGLSSADIGVANLGLSLQDDSPVLLLEVPQAPEAAIPRKHLAWAEIDANANLLLPNAAPLIGELPFDPIKRPSNDGRAALLIRPGKNLTEGRRYVVVLRGLKNAAGDALAAQTAFASCRNKTASALPPVQARCAALERDVFPVLDAAGIARDDSLYLAWDFTVASTNGMVGRLRHMRDDAFASLAKTSGSDCSTARDDDACNAPTFTVDKVTEAPQNGIARRIEGTLTVPSYLVSSDASPLEDARLSAGLDALCSNIPKDAPEEFRSGCADFRDVAGIGQGIATPLNRLNYTPGSSNPCTGLSPDQIPSSHCAEQLRYGDGLPDRNGTLSTRFICQIPARATPDAPARAGIYGHGLLDSRVAVTYDGVPDLSREHNYLFCAVDFYGFATGDLANVGAALLDVSTFGVIPDASQQGIVNFAFLARLLRDANGFAADPAFQSGGRPLFDRSEVFYDGNSQGGILGGVVMAASKDVQRGALGSLGMNYSTLLTRSTDFDEYALPLYAAYIDPLDRQLVLSMIQMLWDRSENNGYAAHLTDNSAFGGEPKIVKLDPQFGDHQVTMWSADVMARTMGIPVSASHTARVAAKLGQARRHPDLVPYLGLTALDFDNASQKAGGAMQVWDDERTLIPPLGNNPPREGRDPHDDSAKKVSGRCQKAHFLRTGGKLVDVTAVEFDGATCPAVPPAAPAPTISDADGDGVADAVDACPGTPAGSSVGADGCPAEPSGSAFSRFIDTLMAAFEALLSGDVQTAIAILQGGGNELAASTLTQVATTVGDAAGLTLPPPAQDPAPDLPAPQALMAGIAKGAVRIPVGTPLGGYLRPPVGGEYLPGLEAFAGGDPSKFFAELIDFLPIEQDHDGLPLAPLPDELRKLHSPYATYSPPSRGYYDSLVAKAVALYDGHDYVVLVKTDFIGMLDELVQGVADKVQADTVSAEHPDGIDLHEGLIMSATHTHDGPGAVGNHSIRYFWLAIDAYQPEVYQRAVDDLAKLVKRAVLNMQPAKIGHAMGSEGFEHPVKGHTELNGYRRSLLPSYSQQANDDVRRRLGLLRIDKADGTPLAVVMNFAVHGIAFDVENQYFSGDVPASLERSTEQLLNLPLAMMVQNTGGNISPRGVDNDNKLQRIESFGETFAPEVQAIYNGISSFQTAPDLRTVSQRIILNRERLGYKDGEFPYAWGGAQCNNDVAVPFADVGVNDIPGYEQTGLPGKLSQCIPATPPDAIDLADNGVGENGALVPQDTRLTAAKIGDITLLTQPGEPLTEYGVRLLNIAGDEGYVRNDTFIWGYSQDHVGYILAPEKADWDMGGTEGTTTFWGWKQGQRLLDVNRELLIALRDGKAAPADEFQINYFYNQFYDQQPGAPVIPSPRPGRAVTEPADIARFAATSFAWEGGDPVIDSPSVLLEQEVNGSWQPVKRANGDEINTLFEMHLKYRLVTGAHVWTLDFEAPKDWPVGRYRFSVSGIARQAADAAYALSSQAFNVAPSNSLVLSTPVVSGSNVEVTLAYAACPDNYRVIDALVPGDRPAPVRQGRVLFSNGSTMVEDREPSIEVRDGRLVAIYRAVLGGTVTVSGSDVYGNLSTGGSTPPPVADAGPDRGSGVLGVIADFFASLNTVIASLGNGDPAMAGAQLQAALTTLGEDLAEALFTGETGLIALLTHFGENLAGGDPEAAGTGLDRDLGAFAGLDTSVSAALQRSGSAARQVEAVVMTGNQLPGWSAPAAQGSPYPYPSGATISGAIFDPTPIPGQVRNAHNGVFFYPAGWEPGDAPVAGIGAPVAEIAAYAYTGGAWREIPVQVDERYPFFLANSSSDFSVYSGTDEELTYAWDRETWNPGETPDGCFAVSPPGVPDPVGGLDDDDELTFMAADAGEMAPQGALPPGVPTGSASQMVTLADPLATSPDSIAPRFVYLFQKPGGSAFAEAQHYVTYTRAPDADQWIDRTFFADSDPEKIGTSNTGYGANLSGSVCHPVDGKKNSNDRFPRDGLTVSTDTYLWKATGRWMVREIHIRKPDAPMVYGDDLIDRWKGRAFQQSPDSTISLVGFEDEQVNWEANSSLLGERCGPVRCMREVWGADSGTNVTKTETFYRDAVISRYHVRVHPIPPDGLYTSWDYNRGAMLPTATEQAAGMQAGRYYTALRPQGVPVDGINDDIGQIDSIAPVAGQCITSDGPQPAQNGRCPAFLDVADATFNLPLAFDNWEQVSAKGDLGSMVYTFELKGATSLATPQVVPYYRDDACLDDGTGDDPVQRPYPGEASTDSRVIAGYTDRNSDGQVSCDEKQGAYAAHGIHYFATSDVDNAFILGKPINEIDGQQWQFMVPTETPKNVGEPYANVARFPLRAVATPLP